MLSPLEWVPRDMPRGMVSRIRTLELPAGTDIATFAARCATWHCGVLPGIRDGVLLAKLVDWGWTELEARAAIAEAVLLGAIEFLPYGEPYPLDGPASESLEDDADGRYFLGSP